MVLHHECYSIEKEANKHHSGRLINQDQSGMPICIISLPFAVLTTIVMGHDQCEVGTVCQASNVEIA